MICAMPTIEGNCTHMGGMWQGKINTKHTVVGPAIQYQRTKQQQMHRKKWHDKYLVQPPGDGQLQWVQHHQDRRISD